MKILAGELEATSGNLALDNKERIAWLRQDQFAYEDLLVSNVVMMGHEAMWEANEEKNSYTPILMQQMKIIFELQN